MLMSVSGNYDAMSSSADPRRLVTGRDKENRIESRDRTTHLIAAPLPRPSTTILAYTGS